MSDLSLHEQYLSALYEDDTPVSVYLINGVKLQGNIGSFDTETIMLNNGTSQLVFKHAISSIVPAREVELPDF